MMRELDDDEDHHLHMVSFAPTVATHLLWQLRAERGADETSEDSESDAEDCSQDEAAEPPGDVLQLLVSFII